MELYKEMNDKIVGILRTSDKPCDLYAAELIEHLQKEVKELKSQNEFYLKASEEYRKEILEIKALATQLKGVAKRI